jgi:Flp pilus assembly protein TadB
MDLVSIEEIVPASIEFKLGDLGKWITKNASKIAVVGGLALGGYALYKYGQARGEATAERRAREQAQQQLAQQQTQAIQPIQPAQTEQTQTGQITPASQTAPSQTSPPLKFNWITIIIGLTLLVALGVAIWMFFKPKK